MAKKTNGKIRSSRVLLILGISLASLLFLAGIAFVLIKVLGLSIGGSKEYVTSDTYMGYKRGYCPPGQYEVWNGGAPTGDPREDNVCMSKSGVDQREKNYNAGMDLKPVIFLYADADTEFTINPKFSIEQPFIYPAFNNAGNRGWQGSVKGGQDGILSVAGKKYDYLFWEGFAQKSYKLNTGNVVAKAGTTRFLEDSLRNMGLNAREAGDFITFWGPRLMKNDYNLISFVNDEYAQSHPLEVTPKPDYTLRIFMVYKSVDKDFQITEQSFPKVAPRHGFSLVEWGGTEQLDR